MLHVSKNKVWFVPLLNFVYNSFLMTDETPPKKVDPEDFLRRMEPQVSAETLKVIRAIDQRRDFLGRQSGAYSRNMETLLQTRIAILKGREHAARLAGRHNEMVISEEFIAALELLKGNASGARVIAETTGEWNPAMADTIMRAHSQENGGARLLKNLFKIANESGFFLSRYSEEYERERLEDPNYLIVEGSIPRPGKPGNTMSIADSQVRLTPAGAQESVCPLPQHGDSVVDFDRVVELQEHPGQFGLMEDIACVRQHSQKGYAGFVRDRAFEHIRNDINPQRPEGQEIRQVGAAIAGLLGFERPDGSKVLLSEVKDTRLLINQHSWIAHEKSRYPGIHSYTLHNRRLPVQIGEETYKLLVRWYMFFQPVIPLEKKD